MYVAPPTTCERGTNRASASTLSMPFCSVRHPCLRPNQRDNGRRRALDVVEFDREYNDIDKANVRGSIGCRYVAERNVAERALQLQALPSHCFEVGATGYEGDVFTGMREPRTDDTRRYRLNPSSRYAWSSPPTPILATPLTIASVPPCGSVKYRSQKSACDFKGLRDENHCS